MVISDILAFTTAFSTVQVVLYLVISFWDRTWRGKVLTQALEVTKLRRIHVLMGILIGIGIISNVMIRIALAIGH